MSDIQDYLGRNATRMVDDLRQFVEQESPSTDPALLQSFAQYIAEYGKDSVGARAELIPTEAGARHVRFELGGDSGDPILMLGHFDTVWPEGTLQTMPFQVEDGVARGPGVFDMKCGLVQGFWALRALVELHRSVPRIVFLCTADEELGSPTSRELIEAEARRARLVLVLEPSQNGAVKTARKGVGIFDLHVTGVAAHAGADPQAGASAVEEICRLALDVQSQRNRELGTTVNVGVIAGGTRRNVIAEQALAALDVRVATAAEAERITQFMRTLKPHNPRVQLHITGRINRPPMERTAQIARLFERARDLAAELGFELAEVATGGASDGNFTAALGVPTLDGLCAVGGGAHALSEHIVVDAMPLRSALVARLIETA